MHAEPRAPPHGPCLGRAACGRASSKLVPELDPGPVHAETPSPPDPSARHSDTRIRNTWTPAASLAPAPRPDAKAELTHPRFPARSSPLPAQGSLHMRSDLRPALCEH